MNLSPHFTLAELSFSEVALRKGLPNTPAPGVQTMLTRLCVELLEPVRTILGVPLHINSGYRSMAVNEAVGGASGSAHTFGRAADFVPIGLDLKTTFDMLRERTDLPYDQIIFECRAWLHIAIAPDGVQPRRQALTATGGPGRWAYQPVAPGVKNV